MSYDPAARRDTPLALKLKSRIAATGSMSVREYVHACLRDPEHGYYRTRPAIGEGGDFVTAPEISQVFGELIGLWAAIVWQQMGSPPRLKLIELGPGRGTMLADALRATRTVPGFHASLQLHLVEDHVGLRAVQQQTLANTPVRPTWIASADDILAQEPAAGGAEPWETPAIVLANEFVDCLPQEQYVRHDGGWLRRRVALDSYGHLAWDLEPPLEDPAAPKPREVAALDALFPAAREGDIVEPAEHAWIDDWVAPWRSAAALVIDYGHVATSAGDTLQAVRGHAYEHPLTSPGEADLTMHVDFAAVARQALTFAKLQVDGPVTQAEFLGALGVAERASRLMAANPGKAGAIEAGVARLMAPNGMGTRFKAIGIRSRHLHPLPGLAGVDNGRFPP